LLLTCARTLRPGVHTWLAAHPEAISTAQLIATARDALGRARRLVPIPAALLRAGGLLTGQGDRLRKLAGSLEVDASDTTRELGWSATRDFDSTLREMAAAWRTDHPLR